MAEHHAGGAAQQLAAYRNGRVQHPNTQQRAQRKGGERLSQHHSNQTKRRCAAGT